MIVFAYVMAASTSRSISSFCKHVLMSVTTSRQLSRRTVTKPSSRQMKSHIELLDQVRPSPYIQHGVCYPKDRESSTFRVHLVVLDRVCPVPVNQERQVEWLLQPTMGIYNTACRSKCLRKGISPQIKMALKPFYHRIWIRDVVFTQHLLYCGEQANWGYCTATVLRRENTHSKSRYFDTFLKQGSDVVICDSC